MNKHYYAYFVMVKGKKRFGGCLYAFDMDDAAKRAARACKLSLSKSISIYSPSKLELDGSRADLAVWAIPECLDLTS